MIFPDVRQALLDKATEVRAHSYAPYSNQSSGVAILAANDRIYTGCRFEVANFSSSLCAAKAALACAISDGQQHFQCIAVVGDGPDAKYLCGDCRQAIAEFGIDVTIMVDNNPKNDLKLSALLPDAFTRSL